jgi:2,3-bisphosphoglycerate-dependent phosphoglycerate mutase
MALDLGGVILARHGETNDNLPPGRFQGWTDTPLNDLGRRQASELGRVLAERPEPIASLWASDLSRARETASVAGAAIGLRPLLDWRLREGARGRWEGYEFEEIKASEPEAYAAWRRADPDFSFPGGESLQDLQDRVIAALTDIRARGPLPALAVCHGGAIRVMRCWQDGRSLDAFWEYDVPNVAVVAL